MNEHITPENARISTALYGISFDMISKIAEVPNFVVRVTPVGKPRMTQSDKWNKRPEVIRYREFSDSIMDTFLNNRYIIENHLSALFCFPVPQSWSKKKKKAHYFRLHNASPDIDNIVKSILDSTMEQDKRVAMLNVAKIWTAADIGCIIVFTDGAPDLKLKAAQYGRLQ